MEIIQNDILYIKKTENRGSKEKGSKKEFFLN